MTRRLFIVLLPIAVLGCGHKPPAPTVAVTGRVTFEGEPIKGANVDFVPEQGRPATAITDDDGKFELSTFTRGDGAVAGTHTATVILNDPGTTMIIAGKMSKNTIPSRYGTPKTTPFKFDVALDKENHFELAMTKDEKAKGK